MGQRELAEREHGELGKGFRDHGDEECSGDMDEDVVLSGMHRISRRLAVGPMAKRCA